MIPGSDLLSLALQVVDPATVSYYRFNNRTENSIGQYISQYNAPISVFGSVQPLPRRFYRDLGLNFNTSFYTFYASVDMLDLARDVSGDFIVFNNRRLEFQSSTPWFPVDGWDSVNCVDIGVFDINKIIVVN